VTRDFRAEWILITLSEKESCKHAWQRFRVNGGWKLRLRFAMKKLVDGIPKLARIRR